jgi:WhiB family redox-sensing transcriptional regulator
MLASLPGAGPNVMSMLVGPEWARDAACKDLEPEEAHAYFFPQRGGSAKAGRALCKRCPVAAQCLELALTEGEAFGIWGGTSERQRRVLRREMEASEKRRRKPHKQCSYCGARAVARGLCQVLVPPQKPFHVIADGFR